MSEIYGIKYFSEGMFPIKFEIIYQYELKDPSLTAQLKTGRYKSGSFHVGSNTNFNIWMCEDKIVIALPLKRYF